jgi:hypothetical protein
LTRYRTDSSLRHMTPDEPLQFDTAAPAGTPSTNCAVCKKPVGESYFTAGKAIVCATCKAQMETAPRPRATPALIVRGAVFGLGGALLGAAVYYGVSALTGLEIGIVAIAVGFIVGRAVQLGARGRRGRAFQITALALTYFGIALSYAPYALKGIQAVSPAVIGGVLITPFVVTFAGGAGGILTAIIIAVGLRQAWYMNRDPGKPVFQGPFRLGATA